MPHTSFAVSKVLITESVHPECEQILKTNGFDVVIKCGMSKEELLQEIVNYEALIVRSATKVTADVINAGKSLRLIGRAGTGVDNIDCAAATQQGILVINAPSGNSISAAELACAMIVSLARKVPQACVSLKSGKWERKNFMGSEIFGKTLAVVGLGRIGREVATRMQAFGMRTIGFDPLVSPEASAKFNVQSEPLESIWPQADYITVHTPLIPATKDLINDEVFSKCKKGVKIINCARGGIVNEDALLRALKSGQCGGAGLDVYMEEPPKNTDLVQHPNVICTPHLGASTVEGQKNVALEIAEQFVDLARGKPVFGAVNAPTLTDALAEVNYDWFVLSQFLGAIVGSFVDNLEGATSITVVLHGHELAEKKRVATTGTLIGFLRQLKYEVNEVNVSRLAKECNIEVKSESIPEGPPNLRRSIMVKLQSDSNTSSALGTVHLGETDFFRHKVVELNAVADCADKEVQLDTDPVCEHAVVPQSKLFLHAVNGVEFPNAAKLLSRCLLCHGTSGPKLTSELLGFVAENGRITSAHWSDTSDGNCWCLINGEFNCESTPPELVSLVTHCKQLMI